MDNTVNDYPSLQVSISMLPTFWLNPGTLVIFGASLDTAFHKHYSIQLVWPVSKAVCQLDSGEITGPLIINSQVKHQLRMDAGWIVLVEPRSQLGQQLSERLKQQPALSLVGVTPWGVDVPSPTDDPALMLSPLFSAIGLNPDLTKILSSSFTAISDERITALLNELDRCLLGDCLKPSSWKASEVAQQLALSEGRFLHLFSQQMGISWRPYLLWRRMTCAISAMGAGASATEAAHLAGFSDSAHLSRTFRRFFGMSIRQAQSIFAAE